MKSVIHTHYDNLRIQRNATPAIIKGAYRALSNEYHPDRNPDRDTTRIMQILNDAYAVLSDPDARAKYNAKVAAEVPRVNHSPAARAAERPRPATAQYVTQQPRKMKGRQNRCDAPTLVRLGRFMASSAD